MAGDGKRGQRLGQLIQQEIAKLIVNDLKDPRVGFATVTEVRTAPDLALAKVFVSIYGDDTQRADTLTGLRQARGYLRRELSQRLKLRQMPELEFELDTTLDQAERLESVFRAIHDGETDPDEVASPQAVVPASTIRSDYAEARKSSVADSRPSPPRRRRRKRR